MWAEGKRPPPSMSRSGKKGVYWPSLVRYRVDCLPQVLTSSADPFRLNAGLRGLVRGNSASPGRKDVKDEVQGPNFWKRRLAFRWELAKKGRQRDGQRDWGGGEGQKKEKTVNA